MLGEKLERRLENEHNLLYRLQAVLAMFLYSIPFAWLVFFVLSHIDEFQGMTLVWAVPLCLLTLFGICAFRHAESVILITRRIGNVLGILTYLGL
jgi:hypothetical protein